MHHARDTRSACLHSFQKRGSLVWLPSALHSSDLKPGNILYRKGKVALCDWGSSTYGGYPFHLPTLGYCAPELLLWRKGMDPVMWTPKVDLWSWGIVTVELLNGKYLIENESEIAALNRAVKIAGLASMGVEEREQYDYCIKHSLFQFSEVPDTIDTLVENASPALLEVLHACLHLMPVGRKTSKELIECSWLNDCMSQDDLPDLRPQIKEKREEARRKNMEMWEEFQKLLEETK